MALLYSYGRNKVSYTVTITVRLRLASKKLYTAVPYNMVRHGFDRIVMGCRAGYGTDMAIWIMVDHMFRFSGLNILWLLMGTVTVLDLLSIQM